MLHRTSRSIGDSARSVQSGPLFPFLPAPFSMRLQCSTAIPAVNYSDTDPQISQLQRWCLNRTCRLSNSCWTAVCPRAPGLRRPPWHPDSTGYCRIICLGSWRRGQHCVWLGRVGALFVVQLLGRNLVALRGVVDLGYLAHMTEYLRSQFPDPCRCITSPIPTHLAGFRWSQQRTTTILETSNQLFSGTQARPSL